MEQKYWEKLEDVQKSEKMELIDPNRDIIDYFEKNLEEKIYFDGFSEKIDSIKYITSGADSSVFLVRLKDFKNRTQLVKVYSRLKKMLFDENELPLVLKKYFKILEDARVFLNQIENTLGQEYDINGVKFKIEYSIAPSGILIEKNGEIGSWVREWMSPGDLCDDSLKFEKEFSDCIDAFFKFISAKLNRFVYITSLTNIKVYKDGENKKIKVVFTDLSDYIEDFVKK